MTEVALVTPVAAAWRQFICRACGWVYDEAVGDPDGGLAPGTRFEDIPDDWACPLCGVGKSELEPWSAQAAVEAARSKVESQSARSYRQGPRAGEGVVIVGGGTAGWRVVEALRALDTELPITLVTACAGDRYDKPRLSVALHQALTSEALCRESAAASAERLNVRLLAHTVASGIEPQARRLRTTRGTLRWRELVLAHGARPIEREGLPADLVWRINDLAAYRRLRSALDALAARLSQAPRIAIIGAGLVGCELANDLALQGHPVALVDIADRPLAQVADMVASARLLAAWEAQGLAIRFCAATTVGAVSRMSDGSLHLMLQAAPGHAGPASVLQVDLVIAATGLATPGRLATQAGLRLGSGIELDPETFDTGVPHVHAVGDCVSIAGRPQRYIEPIARQARAVALRIVGQPVPRVPWRAPSIRVKTTSLPMTLPAG